MTEPRKGSFKAHMKVRFSDVDNAGIVYYPRFFHYFHVAREEFFTERLGVPYQEVLHTDKVGFPVVHVEADFKIPVTFGDPIEVEILVDRIGTKSVTFLYHLRKAGDERIRAVGRVVVAAIDMDTFEPEPVPEKYRKLFSDYIESCSK